MTDTDAVSGSIVTTITLPSGGTVMFRDPRELRAKDKKRVLRAVHADEDSMKYMLAVSFDMAEGVAAMLIEQWTVPYLPNAPLPRDAIAILGELTIPDSEAILAAVRPAVNLIFPSSTPDDAGKPGTPTLPASD